MANRKDLEGRYKKLKGEQAARSKNILPSGGDSCYDHPVTEQIKDKKTASLEDEFQLASDPGNVVEALVSELIPSISRDQIERLEDAIRDAQQSSPKDKQRFVDNVNRLLDVCQLRICAENNLYRLTLKPGTNKVGYIHFAGASGGSSSGFANAKCEIVSVPPKYVGNRYQHQPLTSP